MNCWSYRIVPFKFQLGDWILFKLSLPLNVRTASVFNKRTPIDELIPPTVEYQQIGEGFLIRGLPIEEILPVVDYTGGYLRYAPAQYRHSYIDFSISFEEYQRKFSSKTRSTISRKIRKYSEHSSGEIIWKTYKNPDEISEFLQLAVELAKLTYQERLLDAGIPGSIEFRETALLLAVKDLVRGFILFDGKRPVSYLYCPVNDGVLTYAYLGYDPSYMQLSVGTVLQWLAVKQLFSEGKYAYFDFTEGQSEHKRLFATHSQLCANIFLLKDNIRNRILIYTHTFMNRFSHWLGLTLDRMGLKSKIRKFVRSLEK